jgi:hypothetical protein
MFPDKFIECFFKPFLYRKFIELLKNFLFLKLPFYFNYIFNLFFRLKETVFLFIFFNIIIFISASKWIIKWRRFGNFIVRNLREILECLNRLFTCYSWTVKSTLKINLIESGLVNFLIKICVGVIRLLNLLLIFRCVKDWLTVCYFFRGIGGRRPTANFRQIT